MKTENYQLNQWEPTDKLSREDFNRDNAAIDAALKAVADTANGKASAESVTALQQSVNSQIAALSTALGSGGKNCRIAWGNYTGTGAYGSGNPTKLTFGFAPQVVMLAQSSYSGCVTMISGMAEGLFTQENCTVTWSGNSVSWFSNSSALTQWNESKRTYFYIAIGA